MNFEKKFNKKEQIKEIHEGIADHEAVKTTPPEFLAYEKMTEKELLAEYDKEVGHVNGQRESFEEYIKEEEKNGTDAGKSYIGDDKIAMARIKKLQEIMDQQGIPYEKFE